MHKRTSKESLMKSIFSDPSHIRAPRMGATLAGPELIAGLVEHERRARSLRGHIFDGHVINDSSWPILQDLFAAHLAGANVRTTQLCAISGLPQTTLLRYLDHLEKCAVIRRDRDDQDQRVTLVSITNSGAFLMYEYYSRLIEAELALSKNNKGLFVLQVNGVTLEHGNS
jgi:DNA-binding MarR family transcriptional regulator